MDVASLVKQHYGSVDLEGAILAALTASGVDTDTLCATDLAPIDELHAGFLPATNHVLDRLDLRPESRLLDVGSGIGGPARAAASRGCVVTGVDLTPEFVAVARALTARVGLADLATFETVLAGGALGGDGAFDRAMMIHVGMNVPNKTALFAAVRRALADDGLFCVFDQMRVGDAPATYPLPWAVDERSSFLASPDEYAAALTGAGFTVVATEDLTDAPMGPPPPGGLDSSLSPVAVFGPDFMHRVANNMADTRAGTLGAVLILARAA